MINEDRPVPATPPKLNIGSGFNLLIGSAYKFLIGLGGAGAFTNTSKVSTGETWASNPYTWATETRTWLAASQLIDNTAKVSSSITNVAKP